MGLTSTETILKSTTTAIATATTAACGNSYTVVILSDGTVRSLGTNTNGQLGLGDTTQRTSPTQISGITNAIAVACGSSHTILLLSDGTVRTFGLNTNGQLGLGDTTQRTSPTQISGITTATAVACGANHTIIRLSDGTVRTFGLNTSGQLGLGDTTQRTSPTQISGITTATAVACGANHTIIRLSDGTVRTVGNNSSGQLGNGRVFATDIPLQPPEITTATAVAAAYERALAVVRSNGTVVTTDRFYLNWNDPYSSSFTQIPGTITTAVQLAMGSGFTIIRLSNGTLFSYGTNWAGQLGDGTTTTRTSPVQVSGVTTAVDVACGLDYAVAVLSNGTVWSWGYNGEGQLGLGNTTNRSTPTQISGITTATAVACGTNHTIIRLSNSTVRTWGSNYSGMLGDGTYTQRNSPVQPSGVTTATAVGAGEGFTLAVLSNGTIMGWGSNGDGQLGDGTTTDRLTPTTVATGITTATAVAGARTHALARLSNGTVYSWGGNDYGQLGLGTQIGFVFGSKVLVPAQIPGITTATAVACGWKISIIRLSDSTVRTFGDNSNDLNVLGLGDSLDSVRTSPVQISSVFGQLSNVVEVAGGANHTILRLSNGTLRAFGTNDNGECGTGINQFGYAEYRTYGGLVKQVPNIATATAVACGSNHTIVRLSDGSLRAFGLNSSGRLGDGSTSQKPESVVMSVPSGYNVSTPFKSSGSVTFTEIAAFFGGTVPHSLTEYYGIADGVPSSGTIGFNNFYGKQNFITTNLITTTAGTAQWAAAVIGVSYYEHAGLAVDDNGNVYLSKGYGSESAIINNANNTNSGLTLRATSGGSAAFVVKYNNNGMAQWAASVDGAENDAAESVAVDLENVYLAGSYGGYSFPGASATIYNAGNVSSGLTLRTTSGYLAAFVVKYNNNGMAQWAVSVDGTGFDRGYSVALDGNGNVYLAGSYGTTLATIYNAGNASSGLTLRATSGSGAAFVVKYNFSGTAQWAASVDGTGNDVGYSVAVDGSGNVYLAGQYGAASPTIYNSNNTSSGLTLRATSSGTDAVFVVKYNSSGTAQWAASVDGNGDDRGRSVAVDGSGNVYLAGQYGAASATIYNAGNVSSGLTLRATSGNLAAFVVKYNSSGTAQWAASVDGTNSEYGNSVAVDGIGNVYFAGYYGFYNGVSPTIYNAGNVSSGLTLRTTSGGSAAFVVKYNSNGAAQWGVSVDEGNFSDDFGYSVVVNNTGMYLSGMKSNAQATIYNAGNVSSGLTLTNPANNFQRAAFVVKYT